MSAEWSAEQVKEALEEIRRRSTTDPAFRELCFSDPAAAIAEVAGRQPPEGARIRFVDNQGADFTVVLPDPVAPDGELSDAELEHVAGGSRCAASCAASCAVTSTYSYGVPGVGGVACV